MYSSQVLKHFEHPVNVGDLPDPSASVQVSNPVCGDVLQLALKIQNGIIIAARFRAKGCVASVACASVLAEFVEGISLDSARNIGPQQIVEKLESLPPESMHAASLAIDALQQLLRKLA